MRSPYPEFVLTNIICIENALKGTEIVFVLTGIPGCIRTNLTNQYVFLCRVNSVSTYTRLVRTYSHSRGGTL